MNKLLIFLALSLFLHFSTSYAGEADVIKVDVKKLNKNTYHFSVTINSRLICGVRRNIVNSCCNW